MSESPSESRVDETRELGRRPSCPFCDATESIVISAFGSQLLTEQRRCSRCGSYFEAVRE